MSASIPSLGSSAQASLARGFDHLNQAAQEIAQATLSGPQDTDGDGDTTEAAGEAATDSASVSPGFTGPAPSDALVNGIMDSIQAQMQTAAGVTLLHAYKRTTDELASMLAPTPRR